MTFAEKDAALSAQRLERIYRYCLSKHGYGTWIDGHNASRHPYPRFTSGKNNEANLKEAIRSCPKLFILTSYGFSFRLKSPVEIAG